MSTIKRENEYALILTSVVTKLLTDGKPIEVKIDVKKLQEEDNIEPFIHALANIMPAVVYNTLTQSNVDILEFNHIANVLCFKYMKQNDSSDNK